MKNKNLGKRLFQWSLVALALLLCIMISHVVKIEYLDRPTPPTKIKDTLEFKDSVLNFIFELRLDHPYIVYSQAIIESGNFTSNIWRENNNMFGMKMPERRPTLAIGISKGHAVYKNWKECIIDYALFQSSYLRELTEEEYFMKISNSYAEDGSYEKKVRKERLQHSIH